AAWPPLLRYRAADRLRPGAKRCVPRDMPCSRPEIEPCASLRSWFRYRNSMKSVQELYAPQNRCFGCGPANDKGLRIRSFPEGDELVCEWRPQPYHQAFEGILNGGICGALLDCHSNWAATMHLMRRSGTDTPLCTVTAD